MKFVHTVASGYVTGAMFILGISAWYMLKVVTSPSANVSLLSLPASVMAAVLLLLFWVMNPATKWATCRKPNWLLLKPSGKRNLRLLPLLCSGIPDQEEETNKFAIQIPYALGIIATRSVDTSVIGLKELMVQHEERIRNGMKAYSLLRLFWFYRPGGS